MLILRYTRDRVFLRLQRINLYDAHRNQMVQPIIMNYVPPSNGVFAQTMLGAPTDDRLERKPPTEDATANTHRLLVEQRNDIDRILLTVNELKHEIASMKETIAEAKSVEPAESRNPHRRSAFPEELELLTENVSRLNSRVGDIDGLRLEMIVMKRRVKVLEQGYAPSQSTRTVTGYTPPATSRPTPPERRVSALTTRPAHRPLYPNGPPLHAEAGSPVVASSVESRPASTDLYGVSPEYIARGTIANGDQEMRDASSANVTSSISSSAASSLDSGSEPSSSSEPQLQQPPPIPKERPASVSKNLNDREMVRLSDPEDSDYDPDSQRPRTRNHPPGAKVRLPTPDWEKPNWNGPSNPAYNLNNQPLGGPEPDPKRRKTSSFAEGLGAFANGLPASWTESTFQTQTQTPSQSQPQSTASAPTVDSAATYVPSPTSPPPNAAAAPTKQDLRSVPRARDAQGRLLRPDGKIDGRSIRYGHPPKSAGRRASAGDALKSGWATANIPAHIPDQTPIQSPVEQPPVGGREPSNVPSPTVNMPDPPPPHSATPPVLLPKIVSPPHEAAAAESPAPAPVVEGGAPSPGKVGQARAAKKVRYEKERDDEGNLLARNGRVDGRSLRYKKMKEEREGAAAQLEGAT